MYLDTEEVFRELGEELAEVCEALPRITWDGPVLTRAILANASECLAKSRAEQAAGRDGAREGHTASITARITDGP